MRWCIKQRILHDVLCAPRIAWVRLYTAQALPLASDDERDKEEKMADLILREEELLLLCCCLVLLLLLLSQPCLAMGAMEGILYIHNIYIHLSSFIYWYNTYLSFLDGWATCCLWNHSWPFYLPLSALHDLYGVMYCTNKTCGWIAVDQTFWIDESWLDFVKLDGRVAQAQRAGTTPSLT